MSSSWILHLENLGYWNVISLRWTNHPTALWLTAKQSPFYTAFMSHHQREHNLCSGAKAALAGGSPGGTQPGPGLRHPAHLAEGTEPSGENGRISPLASLLMPKQQPGGTCPLAAMAEGERRPSCPREDVGEVRGRGHSVGKHLVTGEQRSLPSAGAAGVLELVPSYCQQQTRFGC